MKPPKRPIQPFGLRIPEDLKSWLEVQARAHKRSLNNEIGYVLECHRAQHQQRQPEGILQ